MKKAIHELMGFEINEDYKFLVVGGYCWGTGDTIEEAMKNARANGDVKKCYCKIVPKEKGEWEICQITGGISIRNKKGWDFKKDEIFLQTWNKDFHVGGNNQGKVTKYGFNLFS